MSDEDLSQPELTALEARLSEQHAAFQASGLALDLTRGKPSAQQLDLSAGLESILTGAQSLAAQPLEDGSDARNYGGLLGIPEARRFGAEMLGVQPSEILVGGNSSLSLMYQYVGFAHRHGVSGRGSSWLEEASKRNGSVKFICPVPGYDRHFTICEHYEIEMIPVPLGAAGPEMEEIEALVAGDPLIKGIWCVPRYSNPTGQTYAADVVRRMAVLGQRAGEHFRIFWDNAYVVHHLCDNPTPLLNLMNESRAQGTSDHLVVTGSTSKITYAGSGISFLGCSESNLGAFERHLSASTIGPDKLNQIRHVRFLNDASKLAQHMERHREILAPKFELVLEHLEAGLGGKGIASWTEPRGGYFISLDTLPGLASEVVALAAQAGVKLTPAGATFPYGRDPENRNIRIAPTFPPLAELEQAVKVFVLCVELAAVRQRLQSGPASSR